MSPWESAVGSGAISPVRLKVMVSKRIGIHLGTGGGVSTAVERAREIGANTFQIFSSSPRMWRAPKIPAEQCERTRMLREKYDIGPLIVIHAGYLINVCSQSEDVRRNSFAAFRRRRLSGRLLLERSFLYFTPDCVEGIVTPKGGTDSRGGIHNRSYRWT